MRWVVDYLLNSLWRHQVISQSSNEFFLLTSRSCLPDPEEADKCVLLELFVEQVRNDVQVGNQRSLQNNRSVGEVKQLNRVALRHSPHLLILKLQVDLKPLEINDNQEDENRCQDVVQVGQMGSVKGQIESGQLVILREHEMEESHQGSFKFNSSLGLNGDRTHGLP